MDLARFHTEQLLEAVQRVCSHDQELVCGGAAEEGVSSQRDTVESLTSSCEEADMRMMLFGHRCPLFITSSFWKCQRRRGVYDWRLNMIGGFRKTTYLIQSARSRPNLPSQ